MTTTAAEGASAASRRRRRRRGTTRRRGRRRVNATAKPWFERDPKRLQWELDEFARHALKIEVEEDDERRLVVRVVGGLVFRGEPVAATVEYAHGHPYFAPEITGDA